MIERVNLINSLSEESKIEILRKNWMSHDARAQMAIVREFGWEKGNKLNKMIISEMGKVMMFRLINALNLPKVKNINDLYNICITAMEFYYPPPSMSYRFEYVSENELLGVVEKCAVIEQVKKLKVTDDYECGCFNMRSGWYKALGLDVKEECLSCIKDGANQCNIRVKVRNWNK
ncbi:MAG: hypothetical protein ACFFD5_11880 [Candidatus Thorarchaeota archaeon]